MYRLCVAFAAAVWVCGTGFAQTETAPAEKTEAAAQPQAAGEAAEPSPSATAVPAGDAPEDAAQTTVAPDGAAVPPVAPPIVYTGPKARIETTAGTITLTLDIEHAPATVKNFMRYVRQGRWNHTVIYRIEPGFVMQMGCVDVKGHGCKQNPPVKLESGNGLKNIRGSVAMAHGEKPNSATSEFFINLGDNYPLDPLPDDKPNTTGFAVFAHVTDGMDIVDAIAAAPRKGGYGPFPDAAPKKRILVKRIRIIPEKKPAAKK